jgi:ribonuclease J
MFSARKIPGNERAIQDVMNDFLADGIEVITPKEEPIHVSGHPYGGEIGYMLEWVRPEIIIPVHGEKSQITAQAKIGQERQVKTLIPDNGALIEIDPESKSAKILCDFDCELRPVVFNELQAPSYLPLKERRRISFHGCVFVSINIDENSLEMVELQMSSIGLLDMDNETHLKYYEECLDELEKAFYSLNRSKKAIIDEVAEALRIAVRRYFRKLFDVKPNTEIHVLIN